MMFQIFPEYFSEFVYDIFTQLQLWISWLQISKDDHLMSVRKEQVEVLEGLAQEERLHHVPRPSVQRVPHLVK